MLFEGGVELASTANLPDPRPRAPFGRRPSSRSQAMAHDAAGSTPFGIGQHARSNNELAHNAVMDALFRRHSKAEAAATGNICLFFILHCILLNYFSDYFRLMSGSFIDDFIVLLQSLAARF